MLHGSCHMLDSFCAGIELCSIACKKLVPEKNFTRLIDTFKFLVQDDLHKSMVQVSWGYLDGIWQLVQQLAVPSVPFKTNWPVTHF